MSEKTFKKVLHDSTVKSMQELLNEIKEKEGKGTEDGLMKALLRASPPELRKKLSRT